MREAEGLTVFLTTHYMDETEICDRIAIIDQGKVVACESPDALKDSMGGDVVTMRTSDDPSAARVLADHDLPAELTDDGVAVRIANGDRFIPEAVRMLDASGVADLVAVDLRRPTLDDVFIKLTGRAIREESASSQDAMRSAARQHGGGR
jgi:ABC-2 type transport system ATP-binding protein